MSYKKNLLVAFLVAAILALPAPADEMVSPSWGYALDLPEGYALQDSRGNDRFHFSHELYPVELQIAVYPVTQFNAVGEALSWVTDQLAPGAKKVAFEWRRRPAGIAQMEGAQIGGWALALALADSKGWLVMAVYGPADRAVELEPLMISTLDGVFTDDGSYYETGPMTAFAWPAGSPVEARYRNGNTAVDVSFDDTDSDASQSVVDREFSLLTAFLGTPYVIPAWKRYYRAIWRDSWGRFAKATFKLGAFLPERSDALLKELLTWTQGFTYERDFSGSDFTNLPKAFASETGDCDSRSLLLVLMLNQLGVDAILLVSPDYGHAIAAADCPGEGARYELAGKKYLVADTTSREAPGRIAADMADSSKWFSVTFHAFPPQTNE